MVNIKAVRASNSLLKDSKYGTNVVAVFVGATSGIGMGTLKQFAKLTTSPKAYIAVRSIQAATPLLKELEASNPQGTFILYETQISLMKNVDKMCDEIKQKEKKVDIVFVSPGYLSFDNRNDSSEGIDIPHSLRYYARLRFVYNLLPLLKRSPNPRVVSILAGGQESPLDLTDLEMREGFSMMKAAKNGTTQTTLAFEELARENLKVTFIHKYPGFVNTGVIGRLMGTMTGALWVPAQLFKYTLLPLLNVFLSMSIEEAGERGMFLVTSAMFPPGKGGEAGVPLPKGLSVAKDSDEGNGVYLLSPTDDVQPVTSALKTLRDEGGREKVWGSTLSVWERALERS